MDKSRFQNALARAQSLMLSEDFNRQVESKARSAKGRVNTGGGTSSDIAAMEASLGFSSSSAPQQYERIQPIQEQKQRRKTGLPENIAKSFSELPPLTEGMEMCSPPSSFYEPLTEQTQQYQQPQQTPTTSGVDYGFIKTIVEDCLKRNSQQMLNEGTIRGFKLAKGNKIQVVDSKGNLYEGTLVLKKKAK